MLTLQEPKMLAIGTSLKTNTTAIRNTAVGYASLTANAAANNTAVGYGALNANNRC